MGQVVELSRYRGAEVPKAPTPPERSEGVVDVERVRVVVAWCALADAMETAELAAAIEGVSAWRRRPA